jgi:hypothetical protein
MPPARAASFVPPTGSLLALLETALPDPVEDTPNAEDQQPLLPAELEASLATVFMYCQQGAAELAEGADSAALPSVSMEGLADGEAWDVVKLPTEVLAPGGLLPTATGQRIMPEVPQEAPAVWDVNAVLQRYMTQ